VQCSDTVCLCSALIQCGVMIQCVGVVQVVCRVSVTVTVMSLWAPVTMRLESVTAHTTHTAVTVSCVMMVTTAIHGQSC